MLVLQNKFKMSDLEIKRKLFLIAGLWKLKNILELDFCFLNVGPTEYVRTFGLRK